MKKYSIVIMFLSLLLLLNCEKREETLLQELPAVSFLDSVKTVASAGGNIVLRYAVENPVEDADVDASSEAEWITDVVAVDGQVNLSVAVNEDVEERTSVVILTYSYGGGESVTAEAEIVQEGKEEVPDPIVALDSPDAPAPAEGCEMELCYTIENPVDGAELKASSEAAWITGIKAADGKVTFTVEANVETSQRSAAVLLNYTYGEGMSVEAETEVVQEAFVPAPIVSFDEESLAMSCEGGPVELAYTVENPVEGARIEASSEAEWITDVEAVDGKVAFVVAVNTETSSRSAAVVLTYSYGDGAVLTAQADVIQEGRPQEPASDLYVARFTTANVATLTDNGTDVTVTFSSLDMRSSADIPEAELNVHTYFQYSYLRDILGLFDTSGAPLKEIVDASGRKYHLPSLAEITLLVPTNVFPTFRNANMLYNDFNESGLSEVGIEDGTVSKMKQGTKDIVYGIRFIGSDQAAAYRWEWHKTTTEDAYLSIKIKALDNNGLDASFDIVADEAYWTDAEIELDFPVLGVVMDNGTFNLRGNNAFYWASTPKVSNTACALIANVNMANANGGAPVMMGHPLRLIAVEQ